VKTRRLESERIVSTAVAVEVAVSDLETAGWRKLHKEQFHVNKRE